MELTVQEISRIVQGHVTGDGTRLIRGAAGLLEAGPQDITFIKDIQHEKLLASTKAAAVIVPTGMQGNGKTLIEVSQPIAAFASVLELIAKEKRSIINGIHPQTVVSPKSKIGNNVGIGAFSIVEDEAELGDGVQLIGHVYVGRRAKVGKDTLLYPHVVLREEVQVGERCIIHANAVIGSDGYGFYFANGRHNKIPHVGTVIIEDDVEIGACTTIDRATTGATIIRRGTKIDNLVQIAHNVEIGPHSLLVAQVGIAGSAKIGQGVVLAGQVGVADHLRVGDGAQVGAQSGLREDVKPGAVMFGSPAQPIQETLKQIASIKKLPGLFKEIKKLKDMVSKRGRNE